jgi:hypothetical protein
VKLGLPAHQFIWFGKMYDVLNDADATVIPKDDIRTIVMLANISRVNAIVTFSLLSFHNDITTGSLFGSMKNLLKDKPNSFGNNNLHSYDYTFD